MYVADGSSQQLSTVIEGLQLDSRLSDGLVSDYRVYAVSSDVTAHATRSNVCTSLPYSNIYDIIFTLKARYDLNCVKSAVKL